MANIPSNHHKPWTRSEVAYFERLADQKTPTRVMGIKLERTPAAIAQKASQERISLKPPNQSPYNRRRG